MGKNAKTGKDNTRGASDPCPSLFNGLGICRNLRANRGA